MKMMFCFLIALICISFSLDGQYKVINYTNTNKINQLLEDGDYLWLCTSGGVYKRKKSNGSVVLHYNTLNSGLKKDAVSFMYKDHFNNYWLAYSNGGFSRFDGSSWTYYPSISVSSYTVWHAFSITSDLLGNLLFATNVGILKYNGNTWSLLRANDPECFVQTVVADDYGNLWFSSRSSNDPLIRIDAAGNIKSFPLIGYDKNNYVHTMEKDANGKLWLSFWQYGIYSFNPATEQWEDHRSAISTIYATSISTDNSGNLWFGSQSYDGICRYNPALGTADYFFPVTSGDYDRYANDVLCDISGNIWIGSWNGLARIDFNTGKWTMPFLLNCLPSEMINCTGVDSKGNAYMFGQVMNMIEFKDNTYWNTYNNFGGYPWHMLIDEQDNKWAPCVSTSYSILLNKFDTENNRTIYTVSENFPSYFDIYGVVKDKYNGLIWIASDKGLTWFDPDDLSYGMFTTSNSNVLGNTIGRIAADSTTVYYNANGPWGKYDIATGIFSEFTPGEGFPAYTYIYDLKTDDECNIWVLTDNHVVLMNGNELQYWNKPPLNVFQLIPGNFNNVVWLYSFSEAVKFNEGTYEVFNRDKGLLGDIYNIDIDQAKNVWFSTGFNGVTRLQPVAPVAEFDFSTACLPEETIFTNTSTNSDDLTRYQWDINNDGTIEYTVKDFNHLFDVKGTYQVKLIACNDDLCSEIVKEVNVFKSPEVKLNYSGEVSICKNEVLELETQIIDSSSPSLTYAWNTGSTGSKIYVSDAGLYYATVTDDHCDGYTDTLNLSIVSPYPGAAICMVTVDMEEKKNMIIWDNIPDQGISSYNVYKLYGNNYVPVGNVTYGDRPLWVDYTSTPEAVAARYAISVIDTCGNESVKSKFHQTIFLGASQGVQPNTVVLNWTRYIDESNAWDYEYFYIFRGTTADNMILYDSVSSAFTEWNDMNAEGNIYYQVGVRKDSPCYAAKPAKKAGAGPFVHSFSNLEDNQRFSGIESIIENEINIYPNPATDHVLITWRNHDRKTYVITIYDISGKVIRTISDINEDRYVLERGNIQPGYYIVELKGNKIMRTRMVMQ